MKTLIVFFAVLMLALGANAQTIETDSCTINWDIKKFDKETLFGKTCYVLIFTDSTVSFSWNGCQFEPVEKGTLMYEWAMQVQQRRRCQNDLSVRTWERNLFVDYVKDIDPVFGKKIEKMYKVREQ